MWMVVGYYYLKLGNLQWEKFKIVILNFRVRKLALHKNSNIDEPCFISWLACSPQTKDYKISVCCFSTIKHAA